MSVVTRNCGGSGSQHTEGWAQSPTAPLEVLCSARGPDAASLVLRGLCCANSRPHKFLRCLKGKQPGGEAALMVWTHLKEGQ